MCIASAAPHPKGAGPQHPQKFIATSTYTSTVLPRATRFITTRGEGGVSLGSDATLSRSAGYSAPQKNRTSYTEYEKQPPNSAVRYYYK